MGLSAKCSCENGAPSWVKNWKLNLTNFRLILFDHTTFETSWTWTCRVESNQLPSAEDGEGFLWNIRLKKMWVLLNSCELFLMSSTNTYKNIHSQHWICETWWTWTCRVESNQLPSAEDGEGFLRNIWLKKKRECCWTVSNYFWYLLPTRIKTFTRNIEYVRHDEHEPVEWKENNSCCYTLNKLISWAMTCCDISYKPGNHLLCWA